MLVCVHSDLLPQDKGEFLLCERFSLMDVNSYMKIKFLLLGCSTMKYSQSGQ